MCEVKETCLQGAKENLSFTEGRENALPKTEQSASEHTKHVFTERDLKVIESRKLLIREERELEYIKNSFRGGLALGVSICSLIIAIMTTIANYYVVHVM